MYSLRNTAVGSLYQHAELRLYAHGYATWWLGGVKPEEVDPDFIIGIASGKPMEPVIRKAYGLKRKSLDEMSEGTDLRLEAARLAPPGTNDQPWHYIVNGNKIHTYYKPSLGGILGKIYSLADLVTGTSLCYLAVAGEHEGRPSRSAVCQGGIPTPPNGFVYVETME